MKLRLLLLCLLCLTNVRPVYAQANGRTAVRVIVTLREQADLSHFQGRNPSKNREQIIAALKATAARGAQVQARAFALHAAAGEAMPSVTPFWIFNGFAITASPSVIDLLAASPEVLSVTPDELAIAPAGVATAAADVEPNLAIAQAPALWSLGWRGQGVVVASLDTGVDVTHPDLAARCAVAPTAGLILWPASGNPQ